MAWPSGGAQVGGLLAKRSVLARESIIENTLGRQIAPRSQKKEKDLAPFEAKSLI
jgi:hypothetical protein